MRKARKGLLQKCLECSGNEKAAYLFMSWVIVIAQDDASALLLVAAAESTPSFATPVR